VVLITADHGNAEEMIDHHHKNQPHTYHTANMVPFMLVAKNYRNAETRHTRSLRQDGKLCDIAPTILKIIGLEKPAEMDGVSLLS
jgi:2,3-bisphosphoglycerate-independent phosphoglycerate mutase